MFFFPYRALIRLHKIPVVTILVSLLCIGIFIAQNRNEAALLAQTDLFCRAELGAELQQALGQIKELERSTACAKLMLTVHVADDQSAEIEKFAKALGVTSGVRHGNLTEYYREAIARDYNRYRARTPRYLTGELQYPPRSWNPIRMLTAAVAHGSWLHLIGNLFFFFAFAAALELILGPVLFLMLLAGLAFGTHIVYSLATLTNPAPLPTLGLSGVVFGVIALATYFMPRLRIQCFLWILVFFRRFALPAWLIATWFVGMDVYTVLTAGHGGPVNLIAHLAGAALALSAGLLVFRQKRHWAQELVEH